MIFRYLCGSIFAPPALYRQNILGTTVNIEDFRLARECAGGDERAMKELYSRYASGLYGLCIRYVGDRELARDLMHDSFIKIYDTIGKYKPTGSLK